MSSFLDSSGLVSTGFSTKASIALCNEAIASSIFFWEIPFVLATSLASAKADTSLFQDSSVYFLESKLSALEIKSFNVSLLSNDL